MENQKGYKNFLINYMGEFDKLLKHSIAGRLIELVMLQLYFKIKKSCLVSLQNNYQDLLHISCEIAWGGIL